MYYIRIFCAFSIYLFSYKYIHTCTINVSLQSRIWSQPTASTALASCFKAINSARAYYPHTHAVINTNVDECCTAKCICINFCMDLYSCRHVGKLGSRCFAVNWTHTRSRHASTHKYFCI